MLLSSLSKEVNLGCSVEGWLAGSAACQSQPVEVNKSTDIKYKTRKDSTTNETRNGKIYQFCHSQGSLVIRQAKVTSEKFNQSVINSIIRIF